jgi:hypothetical protein
LQRAGKDQDPDRRRDRAGDRTDDENQDRRQHHGATAVNVGELSKQRRRCGGREEISGHHPGQIVDPAETPADRRQRRRDNGLLQRGEKHRQHDAEDDRTRHGRVDRLGHRRLGRDYRFSIGARGRPRLAWCGGGNTRSIVGSNLAGHSTAGLGSRSSRSNRK